MTGDDVQTQVAKQSFIIIFLFFFMIVSCGSVLPLVQFGVFL